MVPTLEITIHVTQEDIDRGLTQSCSSCPVSLALLRACQQAGMNVWHTFVGGRCASAYIVENKKCVMFSMVYGEDHFLHHWVRNFDLGKHVEPFSFTLSMPWIEQAGLESHAEKVVARLKQFIGEAQPA